ncbi:cation-transporting P-type ATPase 13A2 [Nematocida sp. AWRm77]|nr:cation-transporting P-type ATPase 13A2 [Nematocida sp. AWRm77]
MTQIQKERTEEFFIQGRKRRFSESVYYIVSVLTLGAFHILCSFFPEIRTVFETSAVPIEEADVVLYKNKTYPVLLEEIASYDLSDALYEYVKENRFRYIYIEYDRKIFNWVSGRYEKPAVDPCANTLTRKERAIFFGSNRLSTEASSIPLIFFNLAFTSVNVYTLFGILLWVVWLEYNMYAGLIFGMMVYAFSVESSTEIKKSRQTKKIAQPLHSSFLLSNGTVEDIDPRDIVVGDLLIIVPFLEIPCDCVIIKGTLAVDEGFVTGESVPMLKKPGSEILGGTLALQALSSGGEAPPECPKIEQYITTGNYIIAQATKTSFKSAKGKAFINLAEEKIVHPPVYFDTIRMIGSIAGVSLPPLAWLLFFLVHSGLSATTALSYAFDLLYSIVSPALPATIWVGVSICVKRLKKVGIICKDLSVANISGHITKVCFDKTGTLTEDGLDVKCVYRNGSEYISTEDLDEQAVLGIQACQSVEMLEGKLLGDPLDIKLIEFSHSSVEYASTEEGRKRLIANENGVSTTVHKLFEFNPNTRRMGAVAEVGNKLFFFCKGSTEVIEELCLPSSLPEDYRDIVKAYAQEGYRVIALAGKELSPCGMEAETEIEHLEKDLSFVCIIVFENKLKKNTQKTISILKASGIESLMCTGDALLTAVSVAEQCGIIEQHAPVVYPVLTAKKDIESLEWKCLNNDEVEFDKVVLKLKKDKDYSSYSDFVIAIEGAVFDMLMVTHHYKKLLEHRCKVYSRMNPLQKSQVVKMYKESELVCFVGDGANDCSAIQSADVGVSLCSAEGKTGEFCVSSYVSYIKEITSLLYIIREGKCTIVSTIATIELIFVITVTQFSMLLLLQTKLVFLSDAQNIYTDILVAIPLPIILSRFHSNRKMTKRRPKKRLAVKKEICRLFVHFLTHTLHLAILIYSLGTLGLVHTNPPTKIDRLSEVSQITTGVFFLFNFQVLYSGLCYASGEPFREPKRRNFMFVFFFLAHTVSLLFLLFSVSNLPRVQTPEFEKIRRFLDLLPLSLHGVLLILVYCVSDAFIVMLLSKIINVLIRT